METLEREAIVGALTAIDEGLSKLSNRDLMSTLEVSDLLLDVRLLLAGAGLSDSELADPAMAEPVHN